MKSPLNLVCLKLSEQLGVIFTQQCPSVFGRGTHARTGMYMAQRDKHLELEDECAQ